MFSLIGLVNADRGGRSFDRYILRSSSDVLKKVRIIFILRSPRGGWRSSAQFVFPLLGSDFIVSLPIVARAALKCDEK